VAEIDVRPAGTERDPMAFDVTVAEGAESSSHRVTVARSDLERLGAPEEPPERFVARCFEFLLQHEPKESILSSFDVTDIGRYFPEFEESIRG
jgi:hypothetical protein